MREACSTAVCSRGARGPTLSPEEPHKPPEIVTCLGGPAALEHGWEQYDLYDGFQSQLWSITLPVVGDLRDAFA